MQQIDMSEKRPLSSAANAPRVRYSAAYPTDAPEKLCFGGKPHEVRPMVWPDRRSLRGAKSLEARPQGAARECKVSSADVGLARLSSAGSYSVFSYGDDVIRFATSPRLVKYTRIKQWNDGYLEVGADYGKGEVEDYIDMRAILDNLYYDTDAFLSKIDKVEVVYE